VLWHSEDVLICLSGELSAKFLNNNGELVEERERERERERGGGRREESRAEREEERAIEKGGGGERRSDSAISPVARICLTILFPCGCRTFRRR